MKNSSFQLLISCFGCWDGHPECCAWALSAVSVSNSACGGTGGTLENCFLFLFPNNFLTVVEAVPGCCTNVIQAVFFFCSACRFSLTALSQGRWLRYSTHPSRVWFSAQEALPLSWGIPGPSISDISLELWISTLKTLRISLRSAQTCFLDAHESPAYPAFITSVLCLNDPSSNSWRGVCLQLIDSKWHPSPLA